ncbi:MAG: AAA family ATPase [Candidatus Hydrogenedentes bacterium]|nr:AAA family ATPase [Candidatus Hydrogenedentota bacterium]
MTSPVDEIRERVARQAPLVARLRQAMGEVLVGQRYMVDRLLVGLLANGHILLEGVPGLAKTTAVTTLAQALACSFKRIQFTPDLLPADLVGTEVYNPKTGDFSVKKGPVFAHILLADEINRAPAKVQSALLEVMQERQVTIGDTTFPMQEPFMVLATQNPLEHEGTYPLPEAQIDRFMLKVKITYPTREEERAIMDRVDLLRRQKVDPVVTRHELLEARTLLNEIYVDPKAKDYIVDIVHATRRPESVGLKIGHLIEYGASPRATLYLQQGARAMAFLQGQGNVYPHDVKQIAMDVLRHRVKESYEAEAENISAEHLIKKILETVPVP